jgi:hypothetical protein
MRKVSAGPLLILLMIFLWNHFASAAAGSATSDLAQVLPLKSAPTKSLPTKSLTTKAAASHAQSSVSVALPAKRTAKKKLAAKLPSKRTIYVVNGKGQSIGQSIGLPKQLPTRTKIIMNFDQPSLPDMPAVVIREQPEAAPVNAANEIQEIRKQRVELAPVYGVNRELPQAAIIDSSSMPHQLRPALPDSDSSVALPAGLARAPQEPAQVALQKPQQIQPQVRVQRQVVIVPQSQSAAPIVMAQPPVTLGSPDMSTLSAMSSSPEQAQREAQPVTQAEVAITAPVAPSAAAPLTLQTPMAPSQRLTPSPELIGPPAPPLFDRTTQRNDVVDARTETEQALDTEKGAQPEGTTTHAAPLLKTTFLVTDDETPRRRLFIRGGYLDAKYDRLESDLRNGASVFGVSVSQVFSQTEVRLGIDVAHGLDQAVNLRNTRMAMFRAEGLYNVFSRDIVQAYVGGALGLADIDVTSYRTTGSNGDVTIRENAKGAALLAAPEVGGRFKIGRQISFDLTIQYLLLAGSSQVSNLGGLLGEAALGFSF